MGSHSGPLRGRVGRRRYALVVLPAVVVAALVISLNGPGAIAATLAAGKPYKLSATQLKGQGFVAYTSVEVDANGTPHPVNLASFATAELSGLCQSVVTSTPLGNVTTRLTAGNGKDKVIAKNLVVEFDRLGGDITFTGYRGGLDAATLSGGPTVGEKGHWGQQADTITIDGLSQMTVRTAASGFTFPGLKVDIALNGAECFPDPPK